jgi:hypothetical protein
MDSQLRNFSLVFTLAAAVVTPAFGQAVAPTVGPAGSEEESAASIPDFSGIWVHALPGFEPLSSGPTALVNRSRRENGTGDPLKLAGDYSRKPTANKAIAKAPAKKLVAAAAAATPALPPAPKPVAAAPPPSSAAPPPAPMAPPTPAAPDRGIG